MNSNFAKVSMAVAVAAGTLLTVASAPSMAWGWGWDHGRRAEVLHRDGFLNREINGNYGRLGGNYGRLRAETNAIRNQEQYMAGMNGGYITRGEQRMLNREENSVQHQIYRDRRWW